MKYLINFLQAEGTLEEVLKGGDEVILRSAVTNMTMGELRSAEEKNKFRVVSVWGHKTVTAHGAARIVMPAKVYEIIMEHSPQGEDTNLVITTASGGKVTHMAEELTKLGDSFGKKFAITPTLNRKAIATQVGRVCSEVEERQLSGQIHDTLSGCCQGKLPTPGNNGAGSIGLYLTLKRNHQQKRGGFSPNRRTD
ncbi:uncharacterized protein LOC135332181 isoform X2 [Halichondria panicea]|uniref:uncharacterized protein LOC135332181 isoform X2 n=1 Tax=Halichondria panicea TaxID=6063 RepID=UPI00312B946D